MGEKLKSVYFVPYARPCAKLLADFLNRILSGGKKNIPGCKINYGPAVQKRGPADYMRLFLRNGAQMPFFGREPAEMALRAIFIAFVG